MQSFCLGHSAYVGSIAVHGSRVFSSGNSQSLNLIPLEKLEVYSGGDSTVHEWDIESGNTLAQSEKLGEDPVRRVCVLSKVSV